MSEANVDIVRGIYSAFGAGDIAAAVAAMSPDIEWNEAENFPYADRNPYHGPDAVLAGVFGRIAQEWDGFGVEPVQFLEAGDTVVMTGRYVGTCKATGRSMNPQVAHFWTVAGGKVVQFQQLADTLGVAKAMGTA